jgi:hypothetical protein
MLHSESQRLATFKEAVDDVESETLRQSTELPSAVFAASSFSPTHQTEERLLTSVQNDLKLCSSYGVTEVTLVKVMVNLKNGDPGRLVGPAR